MINWYEKNAFIVIINFIIALILFSSIIFMENKIYMFIVVLCFTIIANVFNMFIYGNRMIDKTVSHLSHYYEEQTKKEIDDIIKKIKTNMEA